VLGYFKSGGNNMHYPTYRPKRLRQNENFRRLIRETQLSVDNLVMPFFVREGKNIRKPIASLPGHYQLSVDNLIKDAKAALALGIPAVLIFGIPDKKDESGSGAFAKDGIVQKAIASIKEKVPGLLVIGDVCLCEFTSTGHCGVIKNHSGSDRRLDNEATLDLLSRTALSQVQAGADMVAPSAMADGQVQAIRRSLDDNDYPEVPIMAYSAKYASGFYGPFREAAQSAPKSGNRKSYQMDPANSREALREISLDVAEGADIIMVKPALAYLDIIAKAKDKFNLPIAAYNVSGEFSMVKAAAKAGWIDEERITLEILTAIKRAGANIIITYHAMEVAKILTK
jgi:porphobilinogen synthase